MRKLVKPLRIATCQFPVSSAIDRNTLFIRRQIDTAAQNNANVVHFPECALSGYGSEVLGHLDWKTLQGSIDEVSRTAKEHRVWVVVGSYHRPSGHRKPFNSVYLISPDGNVSARYNKRKLYGKEKRLGLCKPGGRGLTFSIMGHKCGFLICQDSCYPELYEEYRNKGVTLIFDSLYNAGNDGGKDSLDTLIDAQLRSRATDYGLWISAANSSARHSRVASSIFRPDGTRIGLRRHVTGITYHDFPDEELGWTYDNKV